MSKYNYCPESNTTKNGILNCKEIIIDQELSQISGVFYCTNCKELKDTKLFRHIPGGQSEEFRTLTYKGQDYKYKVEDTNRTLIQT